MQGQIDTFTAGRRDHRAEGGGHVQMVGRAGLEREACHAAVIGPGCRPVGGAVIGKALAPERFVRGQPCDHIRIKLRCLETVARLHPLCRVYLGAKRAVQTGQPKRAIGNGQGDRGGVHRQHLPRCAGALRRLGLADEDGPVSGQDPRRRDRVVMVAVIQRPDLARDLFA